MEASRTSPPRRSALAALAFSLLALTSGAEELPVLRFSNAVTVREDKRAVDIEVLVTTPADRPAKFRFTTVDGDAKAGTDYVAQIDRPFEATTFTRLRIQIVDDNVGEPQETFYVDIRDVENAVTSTTRVPITIQDDGVIPPPTFGATTAREGDQDKVVEVFLNLDRTLNVNFSMHVTSRPITANNADFQRVDTDVIFNAGKRTASFPVVIRGDNFTEPDETFALILEGGDTVIFTIQDDDEPNSFPNINIDDAAVFEGAGETSVMRFRVSLSEPAPHGARVSYASESWSATEGEDFEHVEGTLFFEPGQVLAWIDVPIMDDAENEQFGEWLVVDLSNPVRANFPSGIARSGFGAIRDDDVLRGRYLFAHDAAGVEGGSITFRLELSSPSSEPLTFQWAVAESDAGTVPALAVRGRDFAGLGPTPMTFLPGETVKTITVPLLQDAQVEGDEYFGLYFSPVVPGLADRPYPAQGVIIDDDKQWAWPQLKVNDLRVVESDGWIDAQLTLSLARAAETEARVTLTMSEATAAIFSDFAPDTHEVVFEPGQLTKTVRLRIGGDVIREPLEHFTIHFSKAQGLTIVRDQAMVTIVDDDGGTRPRAVRPR